MNLSEFKAWFEGFTEDMDGPPSAKQWKRIKKRVSEITSDPTPWPIIERYYIQPYRPYWNTIYCGSLQGSSDTVTWNTTGGRPATNTVAFNAVGKAEALEMESTETF